MFTALVDNELVNLDPRIPDPVTAADKRGLHRGKPRVRCRGCSGPVHIRQLDDSDDPFMIFAHNPGYAEECRALGYHTDESAQHHDLKSRLAAAARMAGWKTEYEVYAEGCRADVVATHPTNQRRRVLEAQISPLNSRDANDRTERYIGSFGGRVTWTHRGHRSWANRSPDVEALRVDDQELKTVIVGVAVDQAGTNAPPTAIDTVIPRILNLQLRYIFVDTIGFYLDLARLSGMTAAARTASARSTIAAHTSRSVLAQVSPACPRSPRQSYLCCVRATVQLARPGPAGAAYLWPDPVPSDPSLVGRRLGWGDPHGQCQGGRQGHVERHRPPRPVPGGRDRSRRRLRRSLTRRALRRTPIACTSPRRCQTAISSALPGSGILSPRGSGGPGGRRAVSWLAVAVMGVSVMPATIGGLHALERRLFPRRRPQEPPSRARSASARRQGPALDQALAWATVMAIERFLELPPGNEMNREFCEALGGAVDQYREMADHALVGKCLMEAIELARILAGLDHSPVVYFIRIGDRVKIGTTTRLALRVQSLTLSLEDVAMLIPGIERSSRRSTSDGRSTESVGTASGST